MESNVLRLSNGVEVRNKLIVAVAGEDEFLDYDQFGLSFDSTDNQVLAAIRQSILEKHSVDLMGPGGDWLYKTRKATTSQNIFVIPNSTAGSEHALSYLDDAERLKMYDALTKGCMHLWSKNKLQEDKMAEQLKSFADLAEKDPLFLAHFTSYAFKKLDSKDLKVVAAFASSLSDADGTPFSQGSEFKKPNWRIVAQAAFCDLDPKLALRVLKLANSKRTVGGRQEGTHFSRHLKTAAKKYLRYREANPKVLEGIYKAGLGGTLRSIYRIARVAPSAEAVRILRWKQKPGFPGADVEIKKSSFDFKGLSDLQIAEKIRSEKLKPQAALAALPEKISPVIAAAIMEQCSGDQAIVLTSMFENQGLLKHKDVKVLYEAKIRTAKQALDRVERMNREQLDEATKQVMKSAKADVRKQQVGNIGKVFVHIDVSGSMHQALEIAKTRGAIIAECVQNPEENFHWGLFNGGGAILQKPTKFTQDAFHAILYGQRTGGSTNCFALFGRARELSCDTDVYITDGHHTDSDATSTLRQYVSRGGVMPKQVVIIKCGTYGTALETAFRAVGVPVSTIDAVQLTESALVTQAIKTAFLGVQAVIEEVLATPLMTLPKWWESVG